MIRVLLADDQALVRGGFRMIIDDQPDMEVVAEAPDGAHAVDLAARTQPHVVLMDIRMPTMDGIEATRRITSHGPTPKVIILTTFDLDEYVYDALAAGAGGFLLKDLPPVELPSAIRVVARGDALLAPTVTRRLIEEFAHHRPPDTALERLATLSDRELEVLRLVARGNSNSEIAAAMFLGESTIKTHIGHLLAKLELRDRVQLAIYAYEAQVIRPGDTAPRTAGRDDIPFDPKSNSLRS
jgi:DNA-binding NarL/FixJ family response regulator